MTLTMTAKGPEDLLAVVPIVLGFEPEDSVVMLTFSGVERFHARIDMPPGPAGDEQAVATLLQPALVHGVESVAFLLYTAHAARARRLARRLIGAFTAEGIDVVECLRADAGRWYVATGRRSGARDRGVPYDAERHPFRAQAAVAGYVTLGSRSELERSVAPDGAAAAEVATALPSARALATGQVVEMVRRCLPSGAAGDASQLAALLVALRDPGRRDAVWAGIDRASAPAYVSLWTDVVRRAPESHVADPAALLAFSAWLAGHGALAWCAIGRCVAVDPDHRLGNLVAAALQRALPPSTWESAAVSGR